MARKKKAPARRPKANSARALAGGGAVTRCAFRLPDVLLERLDAFAESESEVSPYRLNRTTALAELLWSAQRRGRLPRAATRGPARPSTHVAIRLPSELVEWLDGLAEEARAETLASETRTSMLIRHADAELRRAGY